MGRKKKAQPKPIKATRDYPARHKHPDQKEFMDFERRCHETTRHHNIINSMQYKLDMQNTYTFNR